MFGRCKHICTSTQSPGTALHSQGGDSFSASEATLRELEGTLSISLPVEAFPRLAGEESKPQVLPHLQLSQHPSYSASQGKTFSQGWGGELCKSSPSWLPPTRPGTRAMPARTYIWCNPCFSVLRDCHYAYPKLNDCFFHNFSRYCQNDQHLCSLFCPLVYSIKHLNVLQKYSKYTPERSKHH